MKGDNDFFILDVGSDNPEPMFWKTRHHMNPFAFIMTLKGLVHFSLDAAVKLARQTDSTAAFDLSGLDQRSILDLLPTIIQAGAGPIIFPMIRIGGEQTGQSICGLTNFVMEACRGWLSTSDRPLPKFWLRESMFHPFGDPTMHVPSDYSGIVTCADRIEKLRASMPDQERLIFIADYPEGTKLSQCHCPGVDYAIIHAHTEALYDALV